VSYPDGYTLPQGPGWDNAQNFAGSFKSLTDTQLQSLVDKYDSLADGRSFGSLSGDDLAVMFAVISQTESNGGNYSAVNQYGFAGAWQMGAAALQDAGIVSSQSGNASLYPPGFSGYNNGTGSAVFNTASGVDSLSAFLNNPDVQDQAMLTLMQKNYQTLIQYGAIQADYPPEAIAAALNMAWGLGAGNTAAILTGNNNIIGGRTPASSDGNGYSYFSRYSTMVDSIQRYRNQ
jgi:hypothetical protein